MSISHRVSALLTIDTSFKSRKELAAYLARAKLMQGLLDAPKTAKIFELPYGVERTP
jgi:hypothetical protein